MENPIARLGDTSTHGGEIITSATKSVCEGKLVARVTDTLSCPLHGPNPIITGSPHFLCEGELVARSTSVTECGAVIIGGATQSVCE